MDGRLGVLGVGPQGEQLYRHVLRAPGLTLAAHVAQLGWTDYEAEHAIEQLRARRLVRVTDLGEVVADHPRAALERVVSAEEARLATRRQDLARVRDAIDSFVTDHRVGQEISAVDQPVRERVDRAVLVSVHEHLMASTVGVVRQTLSTVPDRSVEDYPTVRQQLESGREQRTLYLPSALEGDGTWLSDWAALGEQQRVAGQLPSDFVCFGDEVALGSTDWGRTDGDSVVLRDPMVVAAFVALFDRLWAAATPMDATADTSQALVDWMRQGLTDEAIARAMGISLRTVRRRIAALMTDHDVATRFQLALRIAERRQSD
ncbi:hypothetical protein [Flexivirga meconopsidis]|uniref:hypothetical protein n=1 Tax=Flexivirga meconopsidis TaxID=2977121 RepID=UPI00223F47A1|nr:hypothetical protein [Flexivirga meconopsidis]